MACLLWLTVVLALLVVARLCIGNGIALDWPADGFVFDLRARRIVAALCVGGSLATGGHMLQVLLRNPLASPDLLGASAGASLAVVISIVVSQFAGSPPAFGVAAWQIGPAAAGSFCSLFLVYALSHRRGMISPESLILIGILVSLVAGAIIMLLSQFMTDRGLTASRLLVGGISDETTWTSLALAGVIGIGGCMLAHGLGPAMDALALSDDEAASVGIRLRRARATLFCTSGILTASAVVLAGPLTFVGLMAPHAARRLLGLGAGHRGIAVATPLLGAILVLAADSLVRLIQVPSGRIPLGIIMTLIGGVWMVVLIRTRDVAVHSDR